VATLLESKGIKTLGACGLSDFRSKRGKDLVFPGDVTNKK